ncbi:hypothetical protein [Roseivivax sediminis]|uniref:Uncharacterized protein n=1 Tax=Roseivivax sediminis TaxID=936889 RepID=A0A1I2EJP1_9RHOB|nr:hypothetical protein [Roseivivax sediminis]SFE93304.1 hypothetical protein SAMN04515678_12515 [Roseivivax sediminis]
MSSQDAKVEFHERAREFEETFGGADFFEDGFIQVLERLFTLSALMLGEDVAERSFDSMVQAGFSRREGSWREILEEDYNGIYSETRLGTLVHDLSAYADYGIVLASCRSDEHRAELLGGQIEAAKQYLSLLPVELWHLQDQHLVRILEKAIARWKVEQGEQINAHELALLSGKALQTVKNNLGAKGKPIQGNQHQIEAKVALAWLQDQRGFKSSIWRQQQDEDVPSDLEVDMGEVAFVPVAPDGSIFHPGVKRDGNYLIDEKGREERLADYWQALHRLQSMHVPEWRRPTAGGSWTRVRGVDWKRLPVEELKQLSHDSGS